MNEDIVNKLEREGITLATANKRAAAYAIDEILLSILFLIIYWDKFLNATTYEETLQIVSQLLFQLILLKIVYQGFFTWYYGASIGKILMKIVCINTSTLDKPNIQISFIRALMRVVSEHCFFLGFVWAFANPLLQTWQDKVAKTVVINAY